MATTTSLFKNPAVSQKANPSFVLRKTITTAFTAQGVALRCLQFGKVCQKLHPSRKKLLFLTYQKKRAKKKSVSILQNILCWVFFLLPNTGLGFQRLREEMGRQDSGTISSAKNWAPSCTAWVWICSTHQQFEDDRTGRSQDVHLLKWKSICCSDSDSKFFDLFCLLQTPFWSLWSLL